MNLAAKQSGPLVRVSADVPDRTTITPLRGEIPRVAGIPRLTLPPIPPVSRAR